MFVLFFITACFVNIYSGISVNVFWKLRLEKIYKWSKEKKRSFSHFLKLWTMSIFYHFYYISFLLAMRF